MSSEAVHRAWRRQYSPLVLTSASLAALVVAVAIGWTHTSMLGLSVATVSGVAVLLAIPMLFRAAGISLAQRDIQPPLVPLPELDVEDAPPAEDGV